MDYVEFAIYSLPRESGEGDLSRLRSDCLAIVSRFSVDYLWHREAFNINPPGAGLFTNARLF